MANITFVSTTLPKFVAEAARRYIIAEAALSTPLANVVMTFGEALLTITGSIGQSATIDTSTGNGVIQFTDTVPGNTPVLTGTPLSDVTASSLAEALMAAIIRLDAMEAARLNSNGTLPAGVGSSFSLGDGGATFTAVLPIAYTLDASGNQVATVANYLA